MTLDLLVRTLLVGLAGWRLASLLVDEEGPFDLFVRLRHRAGVGQGEWGTTSGFLGLLFSCVWCMSVWTCSGMWALWYVHPMIVAIPATWAVALVAARAVR